MKISFNKRVYNRLIYYSYILPFARRNESTHIINPKNTILIFSNPRGGSTWLAEILNSIPSLAIEPLKLGKLKEFNKLNFCRYQPIPENAN